MRRPAATGARRLARALGWAALPTLLLVGLTTAAHAHLMVAQHGTINIKDAGAWFVISVPVSALVGVDDDGDGRLALTEMAAHNGAIEAQITQGLELRDDGGPRTMEGLLLNPTFPHGQVGQPVEHLVAMGRFAPAPNRGALRFKATLFGRGATEQTLKLKVTRGAESDVVVLTPQAADLELLSTLAPPCQLEGWGVRWLWVPTCEP